MTPTTRVSYPNSVKFSRRKAKGKSFDWLRLLLYFLLTLLCILTSPVLAKVPDANNSLSQLTNTTITTLQQGKVLYDAGRFAQAVQVLQQAAQEYKQQGNHLRLATTLSNLSLAYQQLGAWTQAQQAITESLNLLKGQKKSQNLLAQALDIQGRLQLAMGQTDKALATWQQTAKIYQQIKNHSGVVRSQINQAQAWRTQGFYRRAVEILEQTSQKLQSQPDSIEKAVGLRSLGDALLVVGDQKNSRLALQQSLEIAQRLQYRVEIGASLFSLGNNARIHQQKAEAIAYYKKTFQVSPSPLTKVQAQLNQLSLLVQTKQLAEIEPLLASIPPQLDQLPPSRATIYAQINYAQSLMKVLSPDLEFLSKKSLSVINTQNLAQLLAATIQQSRSLGDQPLPFNNLAVWAINEQKLTPF